jgi:hypothetical protein
MRGIKITINFKVKAAEFLSHTVTVCEICYVVAIAEYHLMVVEREFAKAQSIPIKIQNVHIEAASNKASPAPTLVQPVISSFLLLQWRVLFYFDYIIGSQIITDKECYLQFHFFDSYTKYRMSIKLDSEGSKQSINKMRVHYFFSQTRNVDLMLKDTKVDIRITEGERWENCLFLGKSQSLHEFISDYCPFKTIMIPKCVYLFSPETSKHIILQVCIFK